MRKVFIHTNTKQLFGAYVARFALQKNLSEHIPVELVNVDELPAFQKFKGVRYKRNGLWTTYDPLDLQSFTLARFMAPELMNYEGVAIMMDPDIFACGNINDIFSLNRGVSRVVCCRKKEAWDTSLMIVDCARCADWNIEKILNGLRNGSLDYRAIMTLADAEGVGELSREWNMLDAITPVTRMVHMTQRVTQPWKTGLPVDFAIVGKKWYWELLQRYSRYYKEHPDAAIRTFFFRTVGEALAAGAITERFIREEIARKHVRPDIFEAVRMAHDGSSHHHACTNNK